MVQLSCPSTSTLFATEKEHNGLLCLDPHQQKKNHVEFIYKGSSLCWAQILIQTNCLVKPHKDFNFQHLHFLLGTNTISRDGMHWETANKSKLKIYATSSKIAKTISLSKESHMNTKATAFGILIRQNMM